MHSNLFTRFRLKNSLGVLPSPPGWTVNSRSLPSSLSRPPPRCSTEPPKRPQPIQPAAAHGGGGSGPAAAGAAGLTAAARSRRRRPARLPWQRSHAPAGVPTAYGLQPLPCPGRPRLGDGGGDPRVDAARASSGWQPPAAAGCFRRCRLCAARRQRPAGAGGAQAAGRWAQGGAASGGPSCGHRAPAVPAPLPFRRCVGQTCLPTAARPALPCRSSWPR